MSPALVPNSLPRVRTKWGELLAGWKGRVIIGRRGGGNGLAAPRWATWRQDGASTAASASDVLWPAAGAFLAMAIFGKMDQIPAPLGAVSAVLFATPTAPSVRKHNIFMDQISCAAIGVLAFSVFGP